MPIIHKLTVGQELFSPSKGAATVDLLLKVTKVGRKWANVHVVGSIMVGQIDMTTDQMQVRTPAGIWRDVYVSKAAWQIAKARKAAWVEFAIAVGNTLGTPPATVSIADINQARAILDLRAAPVEKKAVKKVKRWSDRNAKDA